MAIFPKAVPVRKSWDTAIIVLLFVVLVLASVTTDNFLTALNFSYIFSNTSEIMIIAFAMLFMIILGEIDLSVASILALSSCMLGWSYAQGAPIWLAMIICLAVGTLLWIYKWIFSNQVRAWLIGGNYWHLSVIPWCC